MTDALDYCLQSCLLVDCRHSSLWLLAVSTIELAVG